MSGMKPEDYIGLKCCIYDFRDGVSDTIHEVMDVDETNGYAAINPPIYFGDTVFESVRVADLRPTHNV